MLHNTYSCVLATVCNFLQEVYGLSTGIEAVCFQPEFLSLYGVDGFISVNPPLKLEEAFLRSLGGRVEFPTFKNLERALAYADKHLLERGGLGFSINLRYSVSEPVPFDNDLWHFQWLMKRTEQGRFLAYDQFDDLQYDIDEGLLRQSIETPFNYRDDGRFKPFMVVSLEDPITAGALLAERIPAERQLESVAQGYPLARNREIWRSHLTGLRVYAEQAPAPEALYRLTNYAHIIMRCRSVVWDCLERQGLGSFQPLIDWKESWTRYRNVLGISLSRRTQEQFDRLEEACGTLIDREYEALQTSMEQLRGQSDRNRLFVGGGNGRKLSGNAPGDLAGGSPSIDAAPCAEVFTGCERSKEREAGADAVCRRL